MSKVKIVGNASGSGTLTLTGPNTNSDRTLTLPDSTGTLAVAFAVGDITGATALAEQPAGTDEIVIRDGGTLKRLDIKHIQNTPSFRARLTSVQTIATGTYTKLAMDGEDYDSDGKYDHGTNYRFTPTVAGEYFVWIKMRWDTGTDMSAGIVALYKNGSRISKSVAPQEYAQTHQLAQTVTLDADDYIEAYAYQNSGGNAPTDGDTVGGGAAEDAGLFGAFRIAGV